MGCDIHVVVEVKHNDTWVGVHACPFAEIEVYTSQKLINPETREQETCVVGTSHWPIRSRNYELFAALAGVRGEGPDPKGVPEDASSLARMEVDHWDSDGHSHSYCTAEEFVRLASEHHSLPDLVRTAVEEGEDSKQSIAAYLWKYLGVSESIPPEDVRVVFWFDN